MKLLLIGIGGGIGSILRYLVQLGIGKLFTVSFPAGTLVVNVTGCFAIGVLFGFVDRYQWITLEWRLFLITGLCGGFSTFSSFAYENVGLYKEGNYTYLLLYTMLSVVLGFLATIAGSAITNQ